MCGFVSIPCVPLQELSVWFPLDWGLVLHVDCWLFLWVLGFERTERVVGLESSLHGTSRTEHHTNPICSELVFD